MFQILQNSSYQHYVNSNVNLLFTAKTSDRPVIDRNISPSTLDFLNMSSSSKLALLAFNYEFQFMFWFWTAIVNDNYTSKSAVFHSDICFSQRTPSVFHREHRLFFTENTVCFSQRTPSVFHREYRLFFTENTSVFQT